MQSLTGIERHYAWGSHHVIPAFLDQPPGEVPVAELWFGAHPSAPSKVGASGDLLSYIEADAEHHLGPDVANRFEGALPYLLKLIAPVKPLSLQVHPSLAQAKERFAQEEAAGIARDAADRNYRDANHKPELVYALTTFEALCGFRAPRRAAEILSGLGVDYTDSLHALLEAKPTKSGIRKAFRRVLSVESRPSPQVIAEIAQACAARLATGDSPSPRSDSIAVHLAKEYPGDPGVVVSLLLNPVTLQPGEVMFVPAGGLHAYLSGLAVEVMANSDNVLRAGLTEKHVDIPETLACVDYVAAPPIRIAPEYFGQSTKVFYAPVDDFELSVTKIRGANRQVLRGRGPRIVVCLDGQCKVFAAGSEQVLERGQAVFVSAADGEVTVSGQGTLIQADVP